MMKLRIHGDIGKGDEVVADCDTCGQRFQSLNEVEEHVKKMHKGDTHTGREDGRRKPAMTGL